MKTTWSTNKSQWIVQKSPKYIEFQLDVYLKWFHYIVIRNATKKTKKNETCWHKSSTKQYTSDRDKMFAQNIKYIPM